MGLSEGRAMMAGEWVEYEGVRFLPPFLCMCCGVEVEVRQWAYGRACGKCDTGICQSWHNGYRLEYAHEHPPWKVRLGTSRADGIAQFLEFVTHEPILVTETRDG